MIKFGNCRGFTLLELIITLTIVSILLASAAPMFGQVVDRTHRASEINNLIGAINLARSTAISDQTSVTLCPLGDDLSCTDQWGGQITVFKDPARQRKLTSPNLVIRKISPGKGGKLIARSGNRSYFGFRSNGTAREAIGHFIWCPNDHNPKNAAQIRINMGGRPMVSRKTNSENIVLGSNGKPISCD